MHLYIYSIVVFFRYYGMRKTSGSQGPKSSTSASNATAASIGGHTKKMVAKPIITVTEFTPGTTPQQVSTVTTYLAVIESKIQLRHLDMQMYLFKMYSTRLF